MTFFKGSTRKVAEDLDFESIQYSSSSSVLKPLQVQRKSIWSITGWKQVTQTHQVWLIQQPNLVGDPSPKKPSLATVASCSGERSRRVFGGLQMGSSDWNVISLTENPWTFFPILPAFQIFCVLAHLLHKKLRQTTCFVYWWVVSIHFSLVHDFKMCLDNLITVYRFQHSQRFVSICYFPSQVRCVKCPSISIAWEGCVSNYLVMWFQLCFSSLLLEMIWFDTCFIKMGWKHHLYNATNFLWNLQPPIPSSICAGV